MHRFIKDLSSRLTLALTLKGKTRVTSICYSFTLIIKSGLAFLNKEGPFLAAHGAEPHHGQPLAHPPERRGASAEAVSSLRHGDVSIQAGGETVKRKEKESKGVSN